MAASQPVAGHVHFLTVLLTLNESALAPAVRPLPDGGGLRFPGAIFNGRRRRSWIIEDRFLRGQEMALDEAVIPERISVRARGLAPLLRAMRPRQWVKNLVLLAGILFTLDQNHGLDAWLRVALGIVVYCCLSSAIYLINDIGDRDQDQLHPRKKLRPIASGELAVSTAWRAAAVLLAAGLILSALLGLAFTLVALSFLALTGAYTFILKHTAILDVMALAGCYVVRAVAGAVVISVEISSWLLVCTTLGALLIGLAKRRNELLTLDDAGAHRRSLEGYTLPMLDQMIAFTTGSTLTAYMLYTILSQTGQERPGLRLTIPFVIYGILRFLYLIHARGKGGDPSADLVEDRPLMIAGLLWVVAAGLAMATPR